MKVDSRMNELIRQVNWALAGDPAVEAIEYQGRWVLWSDVKTLADKVTALLERAGVAARAPVGFVPRNRPSAIAAELGMIAAARTIRMIYAFQSAAGIARDIARLKLSAVIAGAEDFTPAVIAVLAEQGILGIALHDMDAAILKNAAHCTAATDPQAPAEPEIQVHTSGTTGPPKHVSLSYGMIAKYIIGQNVSAVTGEQLASPPVLLTFPLGNISGIYTTLPPLVQRRRIILLDRFTLEGWRDYIRRFQPPVPMLPPAAFSMVLDAELPKRELSCIKMIMTGAAPLDPSVHRAFEDRYGIPVLLSYGATEFGGPVAAMTPDDYKAFGVAKRGSVGRPFAGAQLRVIDDETGRQQLPGQEGLLEVIAPRMGPDWIRTTDIVMIDDDGFLYHRGRADGAIMRGGFKLLPEVIERALCLHPAVAAAAVVGISDPRLGQVPAAALQLKPNAVPPGVDELKAHLRQHVYTTHIPTEWRFVEALPRNNTVKLDLPAVRALFTESKNAGNDQSLQ